MTPYPVRWTAEKSVEGTLPNWLTAAIERPDLRQYSSPAEATALRELVYGLGTDRHSAKTARDLTDAALREWGLTDLAFEVEVVISELVTNALRHAVPYLSPAWPIRLRLIHHASYLVCVVQDPSREVPVLNEEDQFAESGRGLHLVEALSAAWGWSLLQHGKVVWAAFTSFCTPAR
ncbi:MAG TPA: ATP-binding protein [Thermopolyspora sp.]|jgi:Anti-sigma regulatory factor (Ser/Thr protein kinase)